MMWLIFNYWYAQLEFQSSEPEVDTETFALLEPVCEVTEMLYMPMVTGALTLCHKTHQELRLLKNEPPYDKSNKMACAPSEDSDQPAHPPSLIRGFAFRMKKAWVFSY